MRFTVALLTIAMMSFSACSTTGGNLGGVAQSLNPFNWFKTNEDRVSYRTAKDVEKAERYYNGKVIVDTVKNLEISYTNGGAILVATALLPSLGYSGAELRLLTDIDKKEAPTELIYEFRVAKPNERIEGTERQREILAAASISNILLESVKTIKVIALSNTMTLNSK